MEAHVLLMTALRAVAVYALVLFLVRLMGKRAIGNFGAFDLLVALMIGEVVDEIIYGDVTFLQGAIPIVVVALMHEMNAWLCYWNRSFDWLLEGKPSVIVRDGNLQEKAMRRERMNEEEVMAHLRLRGIEDLSEVKLAIVESDGEVSAILQDWAEPLQKADLEAKGAREQRPPGKRTDTAELLGEED